MTDLEKYKNAFMEGLEIAAEEVEGASMGTCAKWDSIGQMSLIAVLEDAFGIEFEPDEVMAFTSYDEGLAILRKRGIEI